MLVVGVPAMVVSVVLFSTTSGLLVLDIVDYFINQFGILLVAVVTMVVLGVGLRALPGLATHLNRHGSIRLGRTWMALVAVVAPLALGYVLVRAFIDTLDEPYGGYPAWMLNVFGWGTAGLVLVLALVITFARRSSVTPAADDREEADR